MPVRWAVANGNWSNTATWNDGATLGIPTGSDDVWANNFNVNINQSFSVISLNSTARSGIATPQMTSNNTPSPFVINAGSGGGNYPFWGAFNRDYSYNLGSGWLTSTGVSASFISVDFGVGNSAVIDGYIIHGWNNQTQNPRNWTFDGSNDGVNWTTLHTVTLPAAIAGFGNYTNAAIGNTTAYRFYRVNITLNGGGTTVGIQELELYQPGAATLAAGGSFIFNSGSISGSATSTTAALTAGATNLIQVTATTGTVTLNVSSNVSGIGTATTQVINHSGNCDFRLNGQTFIGGAAASAFYINKSSTGLITVVGNLQGGTAGNSNADALNITNGNAVVTGSLTATNHGRGVSISTPTGILTISGSVTGGSGHSGILLSGVSSQFTVIGNVVGGTAGSATGISHSGTSGTVIGNITGGAGGIGISTAGNLTVTGNVNGGSGANIVGVSLTGATSILTVTGNVTPGSGASSNGATLSGASSQFIIIGNVIGGAAGVGMSHSGTSGSVTGNVTGGTNTSAHGITTAGVVTVTGNVTGGTTTTAYGVNTTNTLTINGVVQGGTFSTAHGINTTAPVIVSGSVNGVTGAGIQTTTSATVTGSIFAGAVGAGIVNSGNNSLTVAVRGDVYSSATQNGIVLTGTGTQVVNLAGNMYNTLGRNAIWCPNIFISNAATSLWRIDTGGGNYKTLYSADSTPNLPPTSSVRNGITYGPALALTGSMVVPSASNVRSGVAVDNTVGTGELTSANVISGINASSDALAVRLKNALTDRTAGNLMSQFNNI